MSPCNVRGCAEPRTGFSTRCRRHAKANYRHGHPTQTSIKVYQIAPFKKSISRWLTQRPEENGWGPLRDLFTALVQQAQAEIDASERGAVSSKYVRAACRDILNVAQEGPDKAILTVCAMYALMYHDGLMFRSDRAFAFQLARRFRAITDINVAEHWNHRTGRVHRVYRDTSPRQLHELAVLIARGVGAVALTVIRTMEAEQAERDRLKDRAFEKLRARVEGSLKETDGATEGASDGATEGAVEGPQA